MKRNILLILIVLISLFLRLYRLDSLPAEMWGDVNDHYSRVLEIKQGHLIYDNRYGGDGSLFAYISFFVAQVFGLSFYSLKLTTALTGVLLTIITFLLAKEIFNNKEISLYSSYIMAVSFWGITYSRQAKPHIFVALFICLTILLILKKRNNLAGIVLGLGVYTQTAYWGFLLVFIKKIRVLIIGLIIAIPLILTFIIHLELYFSSTSYLGEKLAIGYNMDFIIIIYRIIENFFKNFLAFYFLGDSAFRHNISKHPNIDIMSSIFFTIGLILIIRLIIKKKNNNLLNYFLIPFILIQIPAILDVRNPISSPNMGRTIGIMPLSYIAIAYGLYSVVKLIHNKFIKKIIVFLVLIIIFLINFYNYFFVYPNGLPNHNTPFAKVIAEKIAIYLQNTNIIIVDSGWGEWGQPEYLSIVFSLIKPIKINFMNSAQVYFLNSSNLTSINKKIKLVFIIDPNNNNLLSEIRNKFNIKKVETLKKNGYKVATFIEL